MNNINTCLENIAESLKTLASKDNTKVSINPTIVSTLYRCIAEKKNVTIYTGSFSVEGTPIEIIDPGQYNALLVLRIDSSLATLRTTTSTNSSTVNRVGFKYIENYFYIRDIAALDIEFSVVMEETTIPTEDLLLLEES